MNFEISWRVLRTLSSTNWNKYSRRNSNERHMQIIKHAKNSAQNPHLDLCHFHSSNYSRCISSKLKSSLEKEKLLQKENQLNLEVTIPRNTLLASRRRWTSAKLELLPQNITAKVAYVLLQHLALSQWNVGGTNSHIDINPVKMPIIERARRSLVEQVMGSISSLLNFNRNGLQTMQ